MAVHLMVNGQGSRHGQIPCRVVIERIPQAVFTGGDPRFEIQRQGRGLPETLFPREGVFLTAVVVREAADGGVELVFTSLVLIPAHPTFTPVGADPIA